MNPTETAAKPPTEPVRCFYDDDRHRNRALTFHWQVPADWTALLDLPPLSPKQEQARAAILLEAVLADAFGYPGVSYSRRRAFYANKQRYHGTAFSFATVVPVIDDLGGRDLLDLWIAPRGRAVGVQSTFRAMPRLLQAVPPTLLARIEQVPHELVRLRDSNKHLIDYRDSKRTDRMRGILVEQNEMLRATRVDLPGYDTDHLSRAIRVGKALLYPQKALYRVFNHDFSHGGRIYGGWWQVAPKTVRAQLLIDGEPVVELDHPQLHPQLLYTLCGRRLQDDAYTLPGWDRKLAKVGFNVLINASSCQEAVGAIAQKLEGNDRRQAARLIKDLKDRHGAIAGSFHSGVGLKLQAIDADMAEMVLTRLLKQGVPALPIHDSFLVQERHQGVLREAMEASFERVQTSSRFRKRFQRLV